MTKPSRAITIADLGVLLADVLAGDLPQPQYATLSLHGGPSIGMIFGYDRDSVGDIKTWADRFGVTVNTSLWKGDDKQPDRVFTRATFTHKGVKFDTCVVVEVAAKRWRPSRK